MSLKRRARTQMPLATAALAVAILGVFGLELVGDGTGICYRLGFVPARPSFETAFASMWLHDPSNVWHAAGNLVVLLLVGSRVEGSIGSLRFAALFVVGGLAGAGLHVVVDPASLVPLVGCSGSLFAVLAVAATLFGAPMLAFVAVLALTNIAHALGASGAESVSFGAHLGGLFAGFLFVALARLRGVELHRLATA